MQVPKPTFVVLRRCLSTGSFFAMCVASSRSDALRACKTHVDVCAQFLPLSYVLPTRDGWDVFSDDICVSFFVDQAYFVED